MCDGTCRLLTLIAKHGSILHASKKMHIGYARALSILNRLDAELGAPIVARKSGGTRGGGTRLTPFGRRFLKQYGIYQDEVRRCAERELRRLTRIRRTP